MFDKLQLATSGGYQKKWVRKYIYKDLSWLWLVNAYCYVVFFIKPYLFFLLLASDFKACN
jgi:hypothetical protein